MSKEIVVYKENFISRIKRFFKNIFGKKEIVQENTNFEVTNNIEKTNFKEDIIVKQDEEELKILELQKEYKAGKIFEENLTEEEYNKLVELYKKQNEELKGKIVIKRDKIKKQLNELKVDYKSFKNEIERKEFMDNLSKNPELLEKFSVERLTKILQWYKNENEKKKMILNKINA